MAPEQSDVGGLRGQYQGQQHVGLAAEQGEAPRAQEGQQVPPVQEGGFEVLAELHGDARWGGGIQRWGLGIGDMRIGRGDEWWAMPTLQFL